MSVSDGRAIQFDPKGMEEAKRRFLATFPDFNTFDQGGKKLIDEEDSYKREAIAKTREILRPLVESEGSGITDEGCREAIVSVLRSTNLLNWRDHQDISNRLDESEEGWVALATKLSPLLASSSDQKAWPGHLDELLRWMIDLGFPSFLTKAVPTYLLFLWNPKDHIFIKPTVTRKLFKLLGHDALEKGGHLTVPLYQHLLACFAALRKELSELKPRDMVDLQTFAFVVTLRAKDPIKSDRTEPTKNGVKRVTVAPLNLILAGPPGTGKTHALREKYVPLFDDEPGKTTATSSVRYAYVTFHQSYAYEDFVEGLKPVVDAADSGIVRYLVVDGIFKHMVKAALSDPGRPYALFIDEINRGNIANIFGELITLIEPDKRMRWDSKAKRWVDGIRVRLPYTHSMHPDADLFGIPDNLWIIGTMNTADRSIALLDIALRRRFDFEEMYPDPDLVAKQIKTDEGAIDLRQLLEAMNQRIEFLLDRDHTIGHAYLMCVEDFDSLVAVFRNRIIPLLKEYFHGDFGKIQLVFRDMRKNSDTSDGWADHPAAVIQRSRETPKNVFGIADEQFDPKDFFTEGEELSPKSFQKIYDDSVWARSE